MIKRKKIYTITSYIILLLSDSLFLPKKKVKIEGKDFSYISVPLQFPLIA